MTVGSQVRAGQVIAYMGDSGNAEGSVPHVHFEIRQPDGTPVNPYQSLVAAQERQTCETDEARISLTADVTTLPADAVAVIAIDGVGRWLIGARRQPRRRGFGRVRPTGGRRRVRDRRAEQRDVQPVAIADPVPRDRARRRPSPSRRPSPRRQTSRGRWSAGSPSGPSRRRAYGISDASATASAVNAVFDHNRDQLTDPSVLNVGMTLRLPPR